MGSYIGSEVRIENSIGFKNKVMLYLLIMTVTLVTRISYIIQYLSTKQNMLLFFFALTSTVLCTIVLMDIGEPRPIHFMIINGLIMSLILNTGIWGLCFKVLRKKLKYVLLIWLVLSSLGISFVMTTYGGIAAIISFIFHVWFIYLLFKGKGEL